MKPINPTKVTKPTDEDDYESYSWSDTLYDFIILISAISLWIIACLFYPNLDGVSIYELTPTFPTNNPLQNIVGKPTADEAFTTEVSLLNYCVFPEVYNQLITKNKDEAQTYLTSRGLATNTGATADLFYNLDLNSTRRYAAEYNLPYDGITAPAGKQEISSHFYPPICRCINKVFSVYGRITRTADHKELDTAQQAIKNCVASRPLIKRQTLIGNTDPGNGNIPARKYISRHAMLFQMCGAFLISALYNSIDFYKPYEFISYNTGCYAGLFLLPLLMWLGNLLTVNSVGSGIFFGSIIMLPAILMTAFVELMWYYAASVVDVGRRTFMHPFEFYAVISAMFIIGSLENGVFTLCVLVTQVFQSLVLMMAYTGTLFSMHGNIWKTSTSSRTGFFILIFLAGLVHVFHMAPRFPVNRKDGMLLWMLPTVFSVFCYAKMLFIDHFMGDEKNEDGLKKHKITHSEHMFNKGKLLIIAVVIFHFAADISFLRYGEADGVVDSATGGYLTKRLNFEFGELNVVQPTDSPLYNTLTTVKFQDRQFISS